MSQESLTVLPQYSNASGSQSLKPQPVTAALLCTLFDQTFLGSHGTSLLGGFEEPEYQPAGEGEAIHRICFTQDYTASALHEIAHWCIAGEARRQQRDFGYWYEPDGRSREQQRLFEQVEVKPQALEWLFSRACGLPFRVSADNLDGGVQTSPGFVSGVVAQAKSYCTDGVNEDAAKWIETLTMFFKTTDVFCKDNYSIDQLQQRTTTGI